MVYHELKKVLQNQVKRSCNRLIKVTGKVYIMNWESIEYMRCSVGYMKAISKSEVLEWKE